MEKKEKDKVRERERKNFFSHWPRCDVENNFFLSSFFVFDGDSKSFVLIFFFLKLVFCFFFSKPEIN